MEVTKYSGGKEGIIKIDLNMKMLQWYVHVMINLSYVSMKASTM